MVMQGKYIVKFMRFLCWPLEGFRSFYQKLFVGRKLEVEGRMVTFVQVMYNNTRSRLKLDNSFTDEFGEKIDVHQKTVLSPFLFIMVLEALSRQLRTGTSWELLYTD